MRTKKLTGWKRQLIDMVAEETGCEIQYNRCPCNTCFHSKFCKELGSELGHNFWEIVLAVRGDYKIEDIIAWREPEKVVRKTKTKK